MGNPGDVVAIYTLYDISKKALDALVSAFHKNCQETAGMYYDPDLLHGAPAPQPRWPVFKDSSDSAPSEAQLLRKVEEIITYHRTIWKSEIPGSRDDEQIYDDCYFVVALRDDWEEEGLLMVNLNEYDYDDAPTDKAEASEYDKERERKWETRQKEGPAQDEALTYKNEDAWNEKAKARGYDAFMFQVEEIESIVVNLQIANMNWLEFREWEDVRPKKYRSSKRTS